MSDWVRGVLVGFNLGGIFAGTIVFLAVRSAPAGSPNRLPGWLRSWYQRRNER